MSLLQVTTHSTQLLLLLAMPLMGQTWVKVANENDTVVASSPVTVRYGSGTTWSVPKTLSGTIAANNATFGDPIPGTLKELDVQQTATAQTVMVNGAAIPVPATQAPTVSQDVTGTVTGVSKPSTVTTADKTIPLTISIPERTITCTAPKNGGKFSCLEPGQIVTPNVVVPGQTADVVSQTAAYQFTCTAPLGANGPDMTNLSCTAVKK